MITAAILLLAALCAPGASAEQAELIHFLAAKIDRHSPCEDALELAQLIHSTAETEGVDPFILASMIKSESTFNAGARSRRGARGLMQIMPATARYISKKSGLPWHGDSALEDPEYNLQLGVAYLKYLRGRFGGNAQYALMAYNWGPGNLRRALSRKDPVIDSVRDYAAAVLRTRRRWGEEFESSSYRSEPELIHGSTALLRVGAGLLSGIEMMKGWCESLWERGAESMKAVVA